MQSHVVLTVLKDCEVRWALVGWVNPIGPTRYRLPPPPEEGYHKAVEVCKQAAGVGVDGK